MTSTAHVPDVFTPREIARAAGIATGEVRALVASGAIASVDGWFVTEREAVRAVRWLRHPGDAPHGLFTLPAGAAQARMMPAAVSGVFHVVLLATAVLINTTGLISSERRADVVVAEKTPIHLVYLALPGPGGGGGGGGARQRIAPPKSERKGVSRVSSPVPIVRPPRTFEPVAKPVEPPKPPVLNNQSLPPIVAPIAPAPADARDRLGVLEETGSQADSRGPGDGGGVGNGQGTGLGEGQGPGVGPGSGGGTGGGPYRPGSGIDPPRLLREVKPDYTEEARQRGIEGDVVMEIVVRRDGTVGEVRFLERLGHGLDERAAQAVRQWRFSPARRLGTPVDVMVEVAVEFKLR